jgi:hypothetical protein
VRRLSADRDRRVTCPRVVVFIAAVTIAAAAMAHAASPAGAFQPWGWQHALRVVRELEVARPQAPLVLLLGGSCARESTVSDQSWAADVGRLTGSTVVVYNLGSSNQTFEQEAALAKGLPSGASTIVFIALNRGRFTAIRTRTTSIAPAPHPAGTYAQHHYSSALIEPLKLKRQRVRFWVRARYPQFRKRYAADLALLDRLVSVCRRRGYHPVLLEMPRDVAVIGHAFDAAMRRYQAGAGKLARRYGIPYVDFVDGVHFVNRDFYDVDHLVEPGRTKFQSRLAAETSRLLALYGMLPPAAERAAPAPATFASGIDPHVAWPVGMAAVVLVGALAVRRRSSPGLPRGGR